MKADDPRHGSTRGYRAGCRGVCCRTANTRYDQYRRLDLLNGIERTVPALGSQRRIEALQRMAWSLADIATEAGWRSEQAVHRITSRERVTTATAERIADIYDRLCMTEGPSEGARRRAVRRDYAPPLAWDDIDSDEGPHVGRDSSNYRADELAAEWDHLRVAGVSIHAAATQLGVSVGAIEKAIERTRKVSAA